MSRHFFSGLIFTAFIAISLAMALSFVRPALSATGNPATVDVVQGKWAPQFEKELNKALPVYDMSRNLWGEVEFSLFHQGRKGVLIGSDGWLFTDEEFSCPPGATQNLKDNLTYITATRNLLAQRNTDLLVALVPAKARLFPDHLGGNKIPGCRTPVYNEAFRFLDLHRIPAADLLTAMRASPALESFYLRTDTHWTPAGAQFAAARLRELVRAKLSDVTLTRSRFKVAAEGPLKIHNGDLMRYVPGVPSKDLPPDQFQVYTATQTSTQVASASNSLFDDTHAPETTLVGTSYSANPNWNFNGFLKAALQTDILNAAEEGQGPFTVMDKYLKNDAWKGNPPKLLIWEIPERYLLMPHGVQG